MSIRRSQGSYAICRAPLLQQVECVGPLEDCIVLSRHVGMLNPLVGKLPTCSVLANMHLVLVDDFSVFVT